MTAPAPSRSTLSYVEQMQRFVLWLVDGGRSVLLFIGDTSGRDQEVVDQILAYLREQRPDMRPSQVVAESVASFTELMRAMAPAGAVVATRYHNLISALLLGRPAIAIGYGTKHRALMADMGMAEFYQPADGLDSSALIEQFGCLLDRSVELRQTIAARDAAHAARLAEQFTALSAMLFPAPVAAPGAAVDTLARSASLVPWSQRLRRSGRTWPRLGSGRRGARGRWRHPMPPGGMGGSQPEARRCDVGLAKRRAQLPPPGEYREPSGDCRAAHRAERSASDAPATLSTTSTTDEKIIARRLRRDAPSARRPALAPIVKQVPITVSVTGNISGWSVAKRGQHEVAESAWQREHQHDAPRQRG